MNYAKALKLIRSLKGYSQAQAAELAGLDQSYLSKIENGARIPPIEIFDKIVNSLNVPLNLAYLMGADESELKGISGQQRDQLAKTLVEIIVEQDEN